MCDLASLELLLALAWGLVLRRAALQALPPPPPFATRTRTFHLAQSALLQVHTDRVARSPTVIGWK